MVFSDFDHLPVEDLLARGLVALMGVELLALEGVDLLDGIGTNLETARGEDRIAGGVLERRQAAVAKRHGAGFLEAGDANLVHVGEELVAADIEGELHRDGVDRFRQGVRQRHATAECRRNSSSATSGRKTT